MSSFFRTCDRKTRLKADCSGIAVDFFEFMMQDAFKDQALPGPFPYHDYPCIGKILVNVDKLRSKKIQR